MAYRKRVFYSKGIKDTFDIAKEEVAPVLENGDILLLNGGLGAGKTTFVKGFVEFYGIDSQIVSSPTFTLVNYYRKGKTSIVHADLYRIQETGDVFFDELLELHLNSITLIEWGEKFIEDLRKWVEGRLFLLNIKVLSENEREFVFEEDSYY